VPALGLLIKGRIRVVYADGRRSPDRRPLLPAAGPHALVEEDAEFVEFSRPEEHQPVLDHVQRAVAAASAA
jgi:hypothetical protein